MSLPTGNVLIKNGATNLGTAVLDGSGNYTFSTSSLPVGTDPITGTYQGDGSHNGSASPVVSETITPAVQNTTTTINVTPIPQVEGGVVTISGTVSNA